MDKDALVENLIDDGQKLIEELPQHGFEVAAAFWIKPSEDGKWYFYIVSPVVESEGIAKAYRRLHAPMRAIPQPLWIDPLEIRLVGMNDPIARDVFAIHARAPGPRACPIRRGIQELGNVSIEDAYLYPLPVATP